jgi:hypothetical protein
MTNLTKKQRQQLLLEEFLRRTREAPPGERVYVAVGDLFRIARRTAVVHSRDVDKGGDK